MSFMDCTDPYSDQCDLLKRRLLDAEKTLENKNVLIEMLREQLKLMEERHKDTLDIKEQLRYKYCSIKQGFLKSKKICQKMVNNYNWMYFSDIGITCSVSNTTCNEKEILTYSDQELVNCICPQPIEFVKNDACCESCGLNRNKLMKMEDLISEYTDVIGKLEFGLKFFDEFNQNESVGDSCNCQNDIQNLIQTINSIVKDKDFYRNEIIKLSALFKNTSSREKDFLIEKLQKESKCLDKKVANLEAELKDKEEELINIQVEPCKRVDTSTLTDNKKSLDVYSQAESPCYHTHTSTVTDIKICTDQDDFSEQNEELRMSYAMLCECKQNAAEAERNRKEIEKVQKLLLENEQKLKSLQEENENIKMDNVSQKEKAELYEKEIINLKEDIKTYNKQIATYEDEYAYLKSEITKLNTNEELDKEIERLQQSLTKVSMENETLKVNYQVLSGKTADLEEEKNELQCKFDDERKETNSLQYKIENIETERQDLISQIDLYKEDIERLEQSLNTANIKNETLQFNNEVLSEKIAVIDDEKNELLCQSEDERRETESLQCKLEDAETERQNLVGQIETYKEIVQNNVKEHEYLEKVNEDLKAKLEDLDVQNKKVLINNGEQCDLPARECVECKKERKVLCENIHEMQCAIDSLEAEKNELMGQIDSYKDMETILQNNEKCSSEYCERIKIENETLKAENAEKVLKTTEMQCAFDNLEAEKNELMSQIDSYKDMETTLQNNEKCSRGYCERLKIENETLKAEKVLITTGEQCELAICRCGSKIIKLETQLQNLTTSNAEVMKEKETANQESQEMAKSILDMQTIVENLMKEKDGMEAEVQDLQLQADTYRMISKQLESEKCELLDAIETMETQVCAENDALIKRQVTDLEELEEKYKELKSLSEIQENVFKTRLLEKEDEFDAKMMDVNKLMDDVCSSCPKLMEIMKKQTTKCQNVDVYRWIERKAKLLKKHISKVCQESIEVKQSLSNIQDVVENVCWQEKGKSLEKIESKLKNEKTKCYNKPCECVEKSKEEKENIEPDTTEKIKAISDNLEQATEKEGQDSKKEGTIFKKKEKEESSKKSSKMELAEEIKNKEKSPLKMLQAESNDLTPEWPKKKTPIKTVEVEEVLSPFSRHLRFPDKRLRKWKERKTAKCYLIPSLEKTYHKARTRKNKQTRSSAEEKR
ncbi:unnamed protein product [Brassicogethes aeneus]|uniref:Uncharacterized protein n=1 Tax=Brassicogethes aeneus TaxID=1431903 RepID=A0A9P0FJW9_BRAAE|nr:unnamed protein product [Brassicogethes aeneus]